MILRVKLLVLRVQGSVNPFYAQNQLFYASIQVFYA